MIVRPALFLETLSSPATAAAGLEDPTLAIFGE